MKNKLIKLLDEWKCDHGFKIFASSLLSALAGGIFALLNCALWVMYRFIWNGTICVYYILLTFVRIILIHHYGKSKSSYGISSKKIFVFSHIIIFLMNISMAAPIAIMVKEGRNVDLGLIPAIAMAAYTTYRICFAVFNYKKSFKAQNGIIRVLSMINLIDALMAVLTLQNTLIVVNRAQYDYDMFILSAVTSAVIIGIITILSVFSLIKVIRNR